jgi:hypothetical protein
MSVRAELPPSHIHYPYEIANCSKNNAQNLLRREFPALEIDLEPAKSNERDV